MQVHQEKCKGCMDSVHVSPAKLERLIEIASSGRDIVSDNDYSARLQQCSDCTGLQYGTTCRYCGCLVAVRAKLRDSACPYPLAPRWN